MMKHIENVPDMLIASANKIARVYSPYVIQKNSSESNTINV